MDNTNRSAALAVAIIERDAARATFHAAKTSKARRMADEELNFWISKVAMLTVMVERAA